MFESFFCSICVEWNGKDDISIVSRIGEMRSKVSLSDEVATVWNVYVLNRKSGKLSFECEIIIVIDRMSSKKEILYRSTIEQISMRM